jgi:hypothetical protein
MVGTIHQHHACKLCGHLRRGHICTNPNGKESRIPSGKCVVLCYDDAKESMHVFLIDS